MGRNSVAQERLVRTTLDLPRDLLERSNRVVDEGRAKSRNVLIIAALAEYLDALERLEIDRQFAAMAGDEAYQALTLHLTQDFGPSDREALETREG